MIFKFMDNFEELTAVLDPKKLITRVLKLEASEDGNVLGGSRHSAFRVQTFLGIFLKSKLFYN